MNGLCAHLSVLIKVLKDDASIASVEGLRQEITAEIREVVQSEDDIGGVEQFSSRVRYIARENVVNDGAGRQECWQLFDRSPTKGERIEVVSRKLELRLGLGVVHERQPGLYRCSHCAT